MSKLQINNLSFEEKEHGTTPSNINRLKVKVTLNNRIFVLFDTFIYFSYDKKDYIATVESGIMPAGFSAPFVHFDVTSIKSDVTQEKDAEEYLDREGFEDLNKDLEDFVSKNLNEDLKDFVSKKRVEWVKESQELIFVEE